LVALASAAGAEGEATTTEGRLGFYFMFTFDFVVWWPSRYDEHIIRQYHTQQPARTTLEALAVQSHPDLDPKEVKRTSGEDTHPIPVT
jgi:hypothetical protein